MKVLYIFNHLSTGENIEMHKKGEGIEGFPQHKGI